MTRIDPQAAHDVAWAEAQRAFSRLPHREMVMVSANSLGAIKAWYCPVCAGRGLDGFCYTVTMLPPTCCGS